MMTMRRQSLSASSNSSIQRIVSDNAFVKWCKQEESRNADSIALFHAIQQFESHFPSSSPSASPISLLKLARHIHRKFVSLNTGTCHVIDDVTRVEMSQRVHEVLDGKPPYSELFEPLKQPLFKHLRSMNTEFSTTTADVNTTWEDTSSTASSNQGVTTIWFNEEPIDRSSRHDIGAPNTVTHESEDDRFAFFNAVCNRLNNLHFKDTPSSITATFNTLPKKETKRSSESEDLRKIEKIIDKKPYGTDAFAPPPQANVRNLPKRFESLYKKKRQQLASATSDSSGFGSNASDFWSFERYGRSNHGTLERPTRLFPGNNNGFSTLQPTRKRGGGGIGDVQKMTVELRYENDVPMVAKIAPGQCVTLKYFRHLFGVHYVDNCRFFFKSTCEDGSAHYQWTLLFHDDDVIPVFQGRITAICRLCPPPEEQLI